MQLDNQRGGAYLYQWVLATLICTECFLRDERYHRVSLPSEAFNFLKAISKVTLESKKDKDGKETEEDVNLYHGDRAVFVQIKARSEGRDSFGVSEVGGFFTNFYRSAVEWGNPDDCLFLLSSNGSFHDKLAALQTATTSRKPLDNKTEENLLKAIRNGLKNKKQKSDDGNGPEDEELGYDESIARKVLDRTVLFRAPTFESTENGIQSCLDAAKIHVSRRTLVGIIEQHSCRGDMQATKRVVTRTIFHAWLQSHSLPSQFLEKLQDPELAEECNALLSTVAKRGDLQDRTSFLNRIASVSSGLEELSPFEMVLLIITATTAGLQTRTDRVELLKDFPKIEQSLGNRIDLLDFLVPVVCDEKGQEPTRIVGGVRIELLASLLRLGVVLDEQELPDAESDLIEGDTDELQAYYRRRYFLGLLETTSKVARYEYLVPESRQDDYERWFIRPHFDQLEAALGKIDLVLAEYGIECHKVRLVVESGPMVDKISSSHEKALEDAFKHAEFVRSLEYRISQRLEQSRHVQGGVAALLKELPDAKDLPEERALELLEQLHELNQFAQARRLAEKVAEAAKDRDEPELESKFKLQAASAIFSGGFAPELLRPLLELKHVPDSCRLQYAFLRGRQRIGLLDLRGARAEFGKATDLVGEMTDAVPWDDVAELAVHHSFTYVLEQEWEAADRILREWLERAGITVDAALRLLRARLNLSTFSGVWSYGTDALEEAEHLLKRGDEIQPGLRRRFELSKADFLLGVRKIDEGLAIYQRLEAEASADEHVLLALLMRNFLQSTFNAGVFYHDIQRREDLRIDIFHAFESSGEGSRRKDAAYHAYANQKYRIGLQQCWLALEQAWGIGDWIPIGNCFQLLARLYEKDGQLVSAAHASLFGGEQKLIKSIADRAASEADLEDVSELVDLALKSSPTSQLAHGKFLILSRLAGLLCTENIERLLTRIEEFLSDEPVTRKQADAQAEAAGVLLELTLAPEAGYRDRLLNLILATLKHPYYRCREEALGALNQTLHLLAWNFTLADRQKIVDELLNLADSEPEGSHLVSRALEVVAGCFQIDSIALPQRRAAGDALASRGALTNARKAVLSLPLHPDVVEMEIEGIFVRLAPKPRKHAAAIEFPQYVDRGMDLYKYICYLQQDQHIPSRIVATFRSPDCAHSKRLSLTTLLSQIDFERFARWAEELRAAFFDLYREELKVNEFGRMEQTEQSIFSGLRTTTVSDSEARRGLLRVLGRLMAHASEDDALEKLLFNEAFASDPTVRLGVVEGFQLAAVDGFALPDRLLKALMFLAGSSDNRIQRGCVSAIGYLISSQQQPSEEALFDILCALTKSPDTDLRAASTWALNRIWQNRPDLHSDAFAGLFTSLSIDISSRVRLAADTSASWLKVEPPHNSEETDGTVGDREKGLEELIVGSSNS